MKSTVLLLLLCFIVAVSADKIWEYCGTSSDTLALKDILVSPDEPVAGRNFSVNIIGELKSPIAQGSKAHVVALYTGVKLFEGDIDVCQFGLSCPVGVGSFNKTIVQTIPEIAPIGGPYTGKIVMTDQAGNQITCVTFKFDMQEPENSKELLKVANDVEFIQEVNKKTELWQAGVNKVFEGKTIKQIQKEFLGAHLRKSGNIKKSQKNAKASALPESYDFRAENPKCAHPIRDQQHCGSCWAFAASEAISDRFCLKSNGTINFVFSPQFLVSCDSSDDGCDGGYLDSVWAFLRDTGIPTDDCYPYTSGGGDTGKCLKKCKDGSAMQLYKAKDANDFEGESDIMQEIFANGPVEAGFSVYRDFINYKSGVYHHTSGALLGGHAVKIVGWGVDQISKQKYWIIANSWSEKWGMNGYFWMKRGNNECGIESEVVAGNPKV